MRSLSHTEMDIVDTLLLRNDKGNNKSEKLRTLLRVLARQYREAVHVINVLSHHTHKVHQSGNGYRLQGKRAFRHSEWTDFLQSTVFRFLMRWKSSQRSHCDSFFLGMDSSLFMDGEGFHYWQVDDGDGGAYLREVSSRVEWRFCLQKDNDEIVFPPPSPHYPCNSGKSIT